MPQLNFYDDVDSCRRRYKKKFRYCVTHVYLQPDEFSKLWRHIDTFSSADQQHYRHDVLKRGLCMNDCWKQISNSNRSDLLDYKVIEIKNPYPTRIGNEIAELSGTAVDLEHVNICNGYEIYDTTGLRSVSKISFCTEGQGKLFFSWHFIGMT